MNQNKLDLLFNQFQPFKTNWIEVQDCVVNTDWDKVGEIVLKKKKDGLTRKEIEQYINHIHLSQLLQLMNYPNSSGNRNTVLELVKAVIYYRLKNQFPQKEFKFEVFDDKDETTVVYYQE